MSISIKLLVKFVNYLLTENALEVIYDKNKGLFKFMEDVLSEEGSQWNSVDCALVEAFNTIKFVMEFFKHDYELYIIQTKVSNNISIIVLSH